MRRKYYFFKPEKNIPKHIVLWIILYYSKNTKTIKLRKGSCFTYLLKAGENTVWYQ